MGGRDGRGLLFRSPSNNANGNTRDRQGRLVTCEHRGRRVVRTEIDGSITVLADTYDGKRLNSPNDVVVKSDGSIWFTDPPFGIVSDYEGDRAEPELPTNVYRVDGQTGQLTVVAEGILGPNGLCFSPDEGILYVVGSREVPRNIQAFDVVDDGTRLTRRRVHIDAGPGTPTGCAATSTATCGAAGEWARPGSTASSASTRAGSRSGASCCRNAAPTSPSAAPSATASS